MITNQLHYRYAMLASLPFPRAFAGGCVSSAETAVPTEVPNLFAGISFSEKSMADRPVRGQY
jgi:hypothetical protein